MRTNASRDAWVLGTEGSLYLHPFFSWARHLVLTTTSGTEQHFRFKNDGFEHEIAESMRCLQEGLIESPLMPLDESLKIMQTLDILRQQAGLRYTTAGNAGFITGMYVIVIPIILSIGWKQKLRRTVWLAAGLSLAGADDAG